ncbi:hypothetical protein [Sorangium sp. So ce363]|uniref:hypothetical protein n=1 Tax=Sorangium sp. So ce363 TaxID=3133304 RepID=UPI003F5FB1DD
MKEQDALIVGSPDTCQEEMNAYKKLGIDRLLCFQQVGRLPHGPGGIDRSVAVPSGFRSPSTGERRKQ